MGIQFYWNGERQGLIVAHVISNMKWCNTYQHLGKLHTLHWVNHKRTTSGKDKSQAIYKIFLHIYLKHQQILQTTLTMESNCLLAKLALPILEAATKGVLCKKVLLEISQNAQENTCARVSFLIKLQPATLLKKRLWHRCFPVDFGKFLRTPSYIEHLWWFHLHFVFSRIICDPVHREFLQVSEDHANLWPHFSE